MAYGTVNDHAEQGGQGDMSTLDALQLRKHDLRVAMVKCVKAEGRTAMTTMKVWKKIRECQKAEAYLRCLLYTSQSPRD